MIVFIKESLRVKLLENSMGIKPLQVKELIDLGMRTAFSDKDIAKDFLKQNLEIVDRLPNTLTLHRVVFLKNKKDLNYNEVGTHYVINRRELEQSHNQASHVGGGKPYMLTVKAPKKLVDVMATLSNKMQHPHENEISLLNQGFGAKIINIEVFKTSNDVDFEMDDYDEYDDDRIGY